MIALKQENRLMIIGTHFANYNFTVGYMIQKKKTWTMYTGTEGSS